MKTETIVFYVCKYGHRHSTEAQCLECEARPTKRDKAQVAANKLMEKHDKTRRRRSTANYLHNGGMTYKQVGRVLGVTAARARELAITHECQRQWVPELRIGRIVGCYTKAEIERASRTLAEMNCMGHLE